MGGEECEIVAITDSLTERTNGSFFGIPVYSFEEWCEVSTDCIVVCANGYEEEISKIINKLSGENKKYYTPYDSSLYTEVLYVNRVNMMLKENDLFKIFKLHEHNNSVKWLHYFDIYDKWFSKYRNTDVVVCEIGVNEGGSVQIWKDYFGKDATIIGIDILEECKKYEEEQIHIEIGSQADINFLNYIKSKYPRIDILIDDGSHINEHQILTFENMFSHISNGGVYLCEDLHTSYWENYGGGYKKEQTMIEYVKNFIDIQNANYFDSSNLSCSYNDMNMCYGLHFYDSMVLIEKNIVLYPTMIESK